MYVLTCANRLSSKKSNIILQKKNNYKNLITYLKVDSQLVYCFLESIITKRRWFKSKGYNKLLQNYFLSEGGGGVERW